MKKIIFLYIILYSSICFAENKDDNTNKVVKTIPDQITLSSCDYSKKINYKNSNMLK